MTDFPDQSHGSAVDALVVELLDRVERGDSSVDLVLQELCTAHPEHAGPLTDSIRALEATGLLEVGLEPSDEPVPDHLGPFRLLAQLGSGGMGVVHLASQEGLSRFVALKLLRPEQMWFEGARARFRREVEAAARLTHPGIATVHLVGEERGLPYCAFEFIPGSSLDRWVGSTSQESDALRHAVAERLNTLADATQVPRGSAKDSSRTGSDSDGDGWNEGFWSANRVEVILRSGRQVADALAHAHARGVLHRDVKPSNIVVTPSGRAVLVDFGLAALSGATRVTRTGAQLGSLAYMAPEQVRGSTELDGRTDVYGLGASLYELLTGRLPYPGEDMATMRDAILRGDAPSIDEVNPAISSDVATVVAKAMAYEPEERYAHAADFERDLGNVIERRPIEARTPTTQVRLTRWARRNPAGATALILGTLFLIGGPVGWVINLAWTEQLVEESEGKEVQAKDNAERNLRKVVQSFGDLLLIGKRALDNAPGSQAVRLEAVDRAISVFEDLRKDHPDEPRLLYEGARLYRARGSLMEEQRYDADAFADYDRAEGILIRLVAERPNQHNTTTELGALHASRARIHYREGRNDEAAACNELATEYLRAAAHAGEECRCHSPNHVRDYCVLMSNYAMAQRLRGELDSFHALVEEGLDHIIELRKQDPSNPSWIWVEGNLRTTQANGLPNGPDKLAIYEEILELQRSGLAEFPSDRELREGASTSLVVIGRLRGYMGEMDPALESIDEAISMLRKLRREFPAINTYAIDLLNAISERGGVMAAQYDPRAKDVLGEVAREAEALALANESVGYLQAFAGVALANYANALAVHKGDATVGFDTLDRAEAYLLDALEMGIERSEPSEVLWNVSYTRALFATMQLEPTEAMVHVEKFDAFDRDDGMHYRFGADLWNELALSFHRKGSTEGEDQAVKRMFALLDKAVEAGYGDVAELNRTPALDRYRDRPEFERLLRKASRD